MEKNARASDDSEIWEEEMSRNNDTGIGYDLLTILFCIVIIFLVVCGTNSCTASDWNNGTCPKCEVRYELRAASYGKKYYVCPNCSKEVSRY